MTPTLPACWQTDLREPGAEFSTLPVYGQGTEGSLVANYSVFIPEDLDQLELVPFPEADSIQDVQIWEHLRPELLGQLCAQWIDHQQVRPTGWEQYRYIVFPNTIWIDKDDGVVRLPVLRFNRGKKVWQLRISKVGGGQVPVPPEAYARLRLRIS